MQADYKAFVDLGATILVVAKDSEETVRAYWSKHNLPFSGLADPEGAFAERYGQQWKALKLGRMPAQFVIGCQGATIVFSHYSKSMSDIVENKRILELMRALPGCG